MKATLKRDLFHSAVGLAAAVALFFASGLKLPAVDTRTDAYFRDAIAKAGIAYATCRVVNASVSVVKDSSLQLEPAGVGVSLAVGQVLDPIDDLTERLSTVLVTAITSLGVQKLAYEIGLALAPPTLAVLVLLLTVLAWFENARLAALRRITVGLVLLVAAARLCLPLAAVVDGYLYTHFFDQKITAANRELAAGSAELEKLKDFSLPEIDGVIGTIEKSGAFLKRKAVEFKDALVVTIANTGAIVENLLQLTLLYVGIFVIQVLVLPLLAFGLLFKLAAALFQTYPPAAGERTARKIGRNAPRPVRRPADA